MTKAFEEQANQDQDVEEKDQEQSQTEDTSTEESSSTDSTSSVADTSEQSEENIPSMEDMLAETKEVKIGDTVKGEVLAIDDSNQLIVGIEGAGVEGVVPFNEISSKHIDDVNDVVKVGDEIDLVVVKQIKDKENGAFLLSHRRLEAKKVWDDLKEKQENDETITVPVTKVVKGGLVVDAGVRGFIPASMVEDYYVRDFTPYKGKELECKIIEVDPSENRLILSHKEIAAKEHEKEREEALDRYHEGDMVEGKVARITNFGAFVDLGGIDGLVHISQIAHYHVDKVSDELEVGQTVKAKVLSVDKDRQRISLSIKAITPSNWEKIEDVAPKGSVVEGTVRRIVDYGAFVEIIPGVEGLLHISQISHKHVNHPSDVLHEGEQIKVKVLDVQPENHRLSLSMKALEEVPEGEEDHQKEHHNHSDRSQHHNNNRSQRRNNNRQQNRSNTNEDEDTGFSFADLLGDQLKDLNLDTSSSDDDSDTDN